MSFRLQRRTPISVTRIYTGPDGQTRAEKIDVKATPCVGHDGYEQSDTVEASSVRFERQPRGWAEDWLHGVSGGKIPLEPGRVLLSEDLTGK